jgi:hypothetical protein
MCRRDCCMRLIRPSRNCMTKSWNHTKKTIGFRSNLYHPLIPMPLFRISWQNPPNKHRAYLVRVTCLLFQMSSGDLVTGFKLTKTMTKKRRFSFIKSVTCGRCRKPHTAYADQNNVVVLATCNCSAEYAAWVESLRKQTQKTTP